MQVERRSSDEMRWLTFSPRACGEIFLRGQGLVRIVVVVLSMMFMTFDFMGELETHYSRGIDCNGAANAAVWK